MNRNFSFYLSTRIEFGYGYVKKVGNIAKEYGAKKVLLVTDNRILKTTIADTVIGELRKAFIEVVIFDKVKPNPKDTDCQVGGDLAISEKVDMVIALGGGSSMDSAKAIAALLNNPGPIQNIMKPNKLVNHAANLICIPTTAGTGSEVTPFAVITIEGEKRKSCIFDEKIRPLVAILDPEVLRDISEILAASTGIDAMTHAIESYTCRLATPFTDSLSLYAVKLIADNIANMVYNRDDMSCYGMMMGSFLAGIAFGFSDVAAVHCLAEALGGIYDTPHGIANSIFLPIVFEYNIPSDLKKHNDIAQTLGINLLGMSQRENAQAAVGWLRQLSKDLMIPSLKELGYVNTNDFKILAQICMQNLSVLSNSRKINEKDFEKLYWKAYLES